MFVTDIASRDDKKNAKELKEKANDLHKQRQFIEAVEVYSQAIRLHPTSIYYANRSCANLKLHRFDCAIDDATQAIIIDKTYLKGYARRADAYIGLKQYTHAIEDYENAKNIDQNNAWLIAQIAKCNELRQKDGNFYFSLIFLF